MIKFAHKISIQNTDVQPNQENIKNQQQNQQQNEGFVPNNKIENPMIQNQILRSTDFVSRYFTKYYKPIYSKEHDCNLDQYIYQHMNDLCLIGLAHNHVIVKNKLKIQKVSFDCIYQGDLQQMTSGKRKTGSIKSQQQKVIAEIHCQNGKIYPFYGMIQGDIIELNQNIIDNPNWVSENALDKGYFAILSIQNKKFINGIKNDKEVLNEEQYLNQIQVDKNQTQN